MSPTSTHRGSWVALPTPFRDGELDLAALRRLIDRHAAGGTDGVVVGGTTGEPPTLTEAERRRALEVAVEHAAGRLPVMAGVGTNATRTTVELARFAEGAGAASLLVVTPYYNRPGRTGLVRHFGAVAEVTRLPVVLYNVPKRTGVDLLPDAAAEIGGRHANVVAIKEASGTLERARDLRRRAPELDLICGEDGLIADFRALGAVGAISVVGNVAPDDTAELVRQAGPEGDSRRAAEAAERLGPLVRALSLETNPVPVKAALALLGLCTEEVRLPLVPLEDRNRTLLTDTLRALGLLPERDPAPAPAPG